MNNQSDRAVRDRLTTIVNPLRLAIVTSLQVEPATAAEVAESLGVPAEAVRHQLRKLSRSEQVQRLGKSRRRGTTEYAYSADPRCNVLSPGDPPVVSGPLLDRAQARLLRLTFGEAKAAIDARTLHSRDEHALVRFPLPLDERGWKHALDIHQELVEETFAEIERAKSRIARRGEQPFQASAAFLFFENCLADWPYSLSEDARELALAQWASTRQDVDDVRSLTDPLMFKLSDALGVGPAGATELADRIGIPVEKIRYRLDRLLRAGLIRVYEERQRRGTVERLYVSENRRHLFSDEEAADLKAAKVNSFDRLFVSRVFSEALEATRAGAFRDRDFHLARIPMRIDAQGFASISALIHIAVERLFELRERCLKGLDGGDALERLAFSDLLLFEQSPDWHP